MATEEAVVTRPITVTVNGKARSAGVETRLLLVHFLRETLGLTGTHIGCDTTTCGACTVLLEGTPIKSCTVFAVQADGRDLTTVEGLMSGGSLHPIQTDEEIRWAISGNVCRCTGYQNIVKAVQHAAAKLREES